MNRGNRQHLKRRFRPRVRSSDSFCSLPPCVRREREGSCYPHERTMGCSGILVPARQQLVRMKVVSRKSLRVLTETKLLESDANSPQAHRSTMCRRANIYMSERIRYCRVDIHAGKLRVHVATGAATAGGRSGEKRRQEVREEEDSRRRKARPRPGGWDGYSSVGHGRRGAGVRRGGPPLLAGWRGCRNVLRFVMACCGWLRRVAIGGCGLGAAVSATGWRIR